MQKGVERRKSPRNTFITTIDFLIASEASGNEEKQLQRGITINISNSGMCLYVFNPVQEGEEIQLYSNTIDPPCRSAKIKWVKRVTKDVYKVGINCN
ncbi:MAG: PilZ domain-containing protein [Nitrospirae bacterium]|nr:PilZ domain-containing protein [Nitrospirota bacterium]